MWIRDRIKHNDAHVTKADKGNTVVIINKDVYNRNEFIENNNIKRLDKDPTNTFVKELKP